MPFTNHDQLIDACQKEFAVMPVFEDPYSVLSEAWRSFLFAYSSARLFPSDIAQEQHTIGAMKMHLNNMLAHCKGKEDADSRRVYEIIENFCTVTKLDSSKPDDPSDSRPPRPR